MAARHQTLHIKCIDLIARHFRALYQETTGHKLPPDHALTVSDFEKNDNYRRLRGFIAQCLGPHKVFHPRNLYTYIFKHLRYRTQLPGPSVSWKVTPTFPAIFFQLLGYRDLQDIIDRDSAHLSQEVKEQQLQWVQEYQEDQQQPRRLRSAYHCYISDADSFKIGKLGIYDDNTIEMTLADNSFSIYRGKLEQNENATIMDFYKVAGRSLTGEQRLGKGCEVSFKFLARHDFEEHIFLFGAYAAINDTDYNRMTPARVSGPVLLERISFDLRELCSHRDLPFRTKDAVSPIIAAKVAGRRHEEVKFYQRLSQKTTFEERRREELGFINDHNPTIKNPDQLIGRFCCLIYSRHYDALRRLLLTIHPDLTVEVQAIKYFHEETVVYYHGAVELFTDGLFQFKAKKKDGQDYIRGKFQFKSALRPLYGNVSGIFKGIPKSGLSLLYRLDQATALLPANAVEPGFLTITSTEYDQLDRQFDLSNFFAGNYVEGEHLDAALYLSDSRKRFSRLLRKKRGAYIPLAGLYEEYDYHPIEGILRKNYLLLTEEGDTQKIGDSRYQGEVPYYWT